ncbi:hypothetical protein ACVPOR_02815 [Staphylococcus aureus]
MHPIKDGDIHVEKLNKVLYSGTAMYAQLALIKRSMAVVINLILLSLVLLIFIAFALFFFAFSLQFCCTTTLQKQMLLI